MAITPSDTPRRFAFYGRVSTDDQQDPEASRHWQRFAADRLTDGHGEIVAEFFDISNSRSIPWTRRPEATRLLQLMRTGQADFDAVVIGEPQRAFSGNQFGNTFPLFVEFGIELWVPEKGGPIDPDSDGDEMLMTIYGGLSKGERKRIQTRVKTSMTAMARHGSRFLGGRPPYGYLFIDAGPHPNPGKAADGKRLKRLEIDPIAAPVVLEIFDLRLEGRGVHDIARTLNERGIPSPSAHDPERNRHRRQGPWSHGTVKTILENPRYTGYEVWGKAPKQERLIDLDDVAAGHRTIQRRVDPADWVWSEHPAHPMIITLETFQRAQQISGRRRSDRPTKPRASHRTFLLSGIVFCSDCGGRMEADSIREHTRYRCRATRRYPGMDHVPTVDVWEEFLLPDIDGWLEQLFAPERLDANVDLVVAALGGEDDDTIAEIRRLQDEERAAQRQVDNFLRAIGDGAPVGPITPALNEAQARVTAAQNRRRRLRGSKPQIAAADIRKALSETGALASILADATPDERAALYRSVGLRVQVDHPARTAKTALDLGKLAVGQMCVGGATITPSTRATWTATLVAC